jgi:hypothetical protein
MYIPRSNRIGSWTVAGWWQLLTTTAKCIIIIVAIVPSYRVAVVDAQGCPLTLWVFPNFANCNQGDDATSVGTIYADGNCHTLDSDVMTNTTQPLFPGNYAAECTSDGNIHFIHSGCLSDECTVSSLIDGAVCDADASVPASLFATNPTDRPVQDPGSALDSTYFCYFITGGTNNELDVSFAVFGSCSVSAGCQIDGVKAPTIPTVAPPATQPTTIVAPVAVPLATPAPQLAPTGAPSMVVSNTNTSAPASAPSSLPTIVPSLLPTFLPSEIVVVTPTSILGPTNDNTKEAPPFRNSTIQGTASIPVNGTLTLPPPSSPEIVETISAFPTNGALQIIPSDGGSIAYTPNKNFVGFDTFKIEQCRPMNTVGSSSADQECETLNVAVEVTAGPKSENDASSKNDEPDNLSSSSSSSKGIYGLAALAIIPIVGVLYIYRKNNTKKEETAGSVTDRTQSNDIAWDRTVPPQTHRDNDGSNSRHSPSNYLPITKDQVHNVVPTNVTTTDPTPQATRDDHSNNSQHPPSSYLPTTKDQVRDVVPTNTTTTDSTPQSHRDDGSIDSHHHPPSNYLPTTKDQVRDVIPTNATTTDPNDNVWVMTNSVTNPDYASDLSSTSPSNRSSNVEGDMASSKNYRLHGSGRFHPLAAHLMEVRASAGNAVMTNRPNTSTVVSSSQRVPVVAEPQAQAINDIYSNTSSKRRPQEAERILQSEPIIVNAILISDEDDLTEYTNDDDARKIPANRQEL